MCIRDSIVTEEETRIISDFCHRRAQKGTKVFVDPIMGDNGKLYAGVPESTIGLMRHLLECADYAVPNYTEACLLTDTPIAEQITPDEARALVDAVRELGAKDVYKRQENVYVKIPCVTTKGESTAELVRKLSADGIKINVTTIFTPEQVDEIVEAVDAETPSIISLFAGRIADTGVDPIPFVTESVKKAAAKPNCEVLWASTRELINIYQAEACGCQIITVPNSILAKRKNIGRDPYEVSLDTVRGFAKDIASLGFHILP